MPGGRALAVRRQLGAMASDVSEVVREIACVLRLQGLGGGAVQGDPVGRGQRGLDRVAGERVDEPVVPVLAEPVQEPERDCLIDERQAVIHRLVEGRRDETELEVASDDRGRLHEPTAGGRDPVEAAGDDVEHRARRTVWTPGAVLYGAGDFRYEQGVPGGHLMYCLGLVDCC